MTEASDLLDPSFVRELDAIGLEAAVKKITADTAGIWGIPERGLLQPGYVADIAIFDQNTIARREGLGDILAEGPLRAAKKIGGDSLKYCIQVKGMSNLHSDERPTPSLALGIATATRGSDHLRSRPAIDLYHLPEKVLRKIYGSPVPYDGPLSSEHTEYVGKPWQVFWQENCYMAGDFLGICKAAD